VLSEAEGMLGFLLVDERDFHVDVDDAGKVLTPDAVPVLEAAVAALGEVAPWATADIEAALRAALVEQLGLKPKLAFGPVRVAATGRRVSPPLFESLELLAGRRVAGVRTWPRWGTGTRSSSGATATRGGGRCSACCSSRSAWSRRPPGSSSPRSWPGR
jgi:hypothetical protein